MPQGENTKAKWGESMLFYTGFPVAAAAVAVIMDLRTARVDNGWILFSLGIGLFVRIWVEGIWAVPDFLAGALLPAVLLGGLFYFHMLGPGDIKLFCALGGVIGPGAIVKCMVVSFFIGAGISFAILISNGGIQSRFCYFMHYLQDFARTGERKPYYQKGMSSLENFHFTVPVFLSIALYAGGVY